MRIHPITDLASYLFAQIRDGEAERDRVYEPVIGIVTDNKDPDKLGRVKVKLPVISMADDAGWAHVVALGAGKDRGWFFLPEVEDEVLVAFEHGDIRRPIVIGQLWNGKDKSPMKNGGSNGQRAIVSRGGSKILFDDENKKLVIQDGAGIGVITIDVEGKKITIEAKQGDICLQAPAGDLTIVAKELDVSGTLNVHIESLQGIDIGGDKAITIKGQGILQVHGQSIDIQPGGVSAPQAAQASPAEVADPLTATGSGQAGDATAKRDEAQPSGGGASSGGGDAAAATAAASPSSEALAPPEPTPVVVSAAWPKPIAKFGEAIEMKALCTGAAGKAATFTILPADGGEPLGTASGTCGADSVSATWTAHAGPTPSAVIFEVAVEDQKARAGVLAFLVTAEGSLVEDGKPGADLPLILTTRTGEERKVTTDKRGAWKVADVPAGDYRIRLAVELEEA